LEKVSPVTGQEFLDFDCQGMSPEAEELEATIEELRTGNPNDVIPDKGRGGAKADGGARSRGSVVVNGLRQRQRSPEGGNFLLVLSHVTP